MLSLINTPYSYSIEFLFCIVCCYVYPFLYRYRKCKEIYSYILQPQSSNQPNKFYMTIVYEYIENIHKITSQQVLKQIEFIMIMKYQYFVQVFFVEYFTQRNCGIAESCKSHYYIVRPSLPLTEKGRGKKLTILQGGKGGVFPRGVAVTRISITRMSKDKYII